VAVASTASAALMVAVSSHLHLDGPGRASVLLVRSCLTAGAGVAVLAAALGLLAGAGAHRSLRTVFSER
jgi:hypothetical protein